MNSLKSIKVDPVDPLDAADYILYDAFIKGTPLSNMQLENILYIVQECSYRIFGKPIIDAETLYYNKMFPIMMEAHKVFSVFSAMPITSSHTGTVMSIYRPNRDIESILGRFIDGIGLSKLYKMNVHELQGYMSVYTYYPYITNGLEKYWTIDFDKYIKLIWNPNAPTSYNKIFGKELL